MKRKKYNKFTLVSLFCFALFSTSIFGQKTITGTVTDVTTGEGLIGANITIKDSSTGTTTDFDGNYSLEVDDNVILVVSYIGYTSKNITVGNQSVINIGLTSGELLEEVVLIGYGTVKRKDVTGSLKTVSQKDFNRGAVTGPQQLLAGKVAGVNITTDGSPGGGSFIRIRGESSLNASNDPLIVIDGVPLDNKQISGGRNNLNIINPADIESLTVLKDASATAIYGNRASAGVILITTKKGKISDGFKIGYNAKVTLGTPVSKTNVMSADDFRTLINNRYGETSDEANLLGEASTDWQDEIFQNSFGHDHNLSFSGGVGIVPIRASIGYSDFGSILKTDKFNRITGNINLTPGFLDNTLQVKLGMKYSKSKNHFADKGSIGDAIGFDPTQSIKSGNDDFGGYYVWRVDGDKGDIVGLAPTNPVAKLYQKKDESEVSRYIINGSADYRFSFLPALRANLNLAYDYSTSAGSIHEDTTAAFVYNKDTGGGTDNSYTQNKKNSLLEFYLNYKEKLFGNNFDIMAGYSWQHYYLGSDFNNADIVHSEKSLKVGEDKSELYMLSLFGRINYSLGERVQLTSTLRQDHTSRFSPENRSGLFPSFAAAIKIIDNKNNLLNNLRAKLGWGITGQQDLGDDYYLYQGLYTRGFDNVKYQQGEGYVTTYRPDGYDKNIRWETTSTYNLGLDFSIIKDKLSTSIDLYKRYTKDLLNRSVQVPVGSNLTNLIATNIGNMETKGLELTIDYTPVANNNFTWDINTNIAFNKRTITKLNNEDKGYIGDAVGGVAGGVGNTVQIHTVGYEPYSFYVYEQIYDESGQLLPGEFVDRNEDGKITELDKYRIETSSPDFTFGLSSAIYYKKLSFSFAARGSVGAQVYNNIETNNGYLEGINNFGILHNVHPIAVDNNIEKQNDVTWSDYYVQDADFFRFDHITLGYDLGDLIGKRFNIYTTIQNPFLWTNYSGIDPEVFNVDFGNNEAHHGIDNEIYPRSRNFIFGLSVGF